MTATKVDLARARELAVAASVDPRSIYRELREPGSVKGMAGQRARRALKEAGLLGPPADAPVTGRVDTGSGSPARFDKEAR